MPFMNNVILMLKNVRNCRIFLSIKTRKDYYANLNVKDVVDNKKFWRTVKPIFFVKTKSNEKITWAEDKTVTAQDGTFKSLLFKCS